MHRLIRIGICFACSLIFFAEMAAAESGRSAVLVRGDQNFPPYEYIDEKGNPTGFGVELFRAVASEMGLNIEISLGPWNTVRHQLEKGEIDVITGMFYSEHRARKIDFSVPHTIVSHSAFVREGSSIHSLENLRGKRIIVQRGDIMHDYVLENHLTDSIQTVDDPDSALALLSSGNCDAALLSRLQGMYLIEKNGFKNIKPIDPPLFQNKYCFAVVKGESDLLAKINEGLFILKTRGAYRQLHQKWFGIYEERALWDDIRYYILGLALAVLLLTAALFWSYALKKQVAQRTRDLEKKIEEHRETARTLKETEERFQLAVRASSVGLWNWDDIRKDRVWWSPQIYELLGYKVGEIDPSFSQLIHLTHPDDRDKAKKTIANHLKYQTPYNFEYRLRKKKGDYGWFRALGQAQWDEGGIAVRMAGSIQDISALKRSEADRIHLAKAVEQTMEGIIISDDTGCITYVNPAFVKMTGDEINDLLGRDFLRFKSETDLHPEADAIRRILFEGNTWKGLLNYPRAEGIPIQVDTTISPIRDAFDRITNFVAVYRDVTRELELETHLRQSQKMEAIGTLAGGIAHDFNNILYALIGYTELAMNKIPEESHPHNHLKEVLKAAWRARDLVRQILTFSRHQASNEFYPIRIKLVAKEVLNLIRATLPASIEIRQMIDSTKLVNADPTQIHQVLMNLCTNAAHAMAANGGTLTVRARDITLEGDFETHPELSPGDYVQLSIIDTGSGIPAGIIDRIFDPFFTTKTKDKGSGLGLAVVHGIVKNHGGGIVVESQPGRGTTVDVYFPARETALKQPPSFESRISGGTEQILFVDDEAAIIDMARQMLGSLGYGITVRTDPKEALDLFLAEPDRFSLVITDLSMPRMTGVQLAEAIRAIRPDFPVILCSGIDDSLPADMEIAGGIHAFLLKPIVRSDLARTIREVLDGTTEKLLGEARS